MDLQQLRAFVVLAEVAHFGRAAERLHITQPALTKRLRSLEAAVGASLFERGRSGTALTPVGRSLLLDAIRIVADADAFRVRAKHLAKGTQGELDVGFGLSTIELAPRTIAQFKRNFPKVTVSLDDFSSAEQTDRLLDGRLDIGFVRLPVDPSRLASRKLATDRLALACPAGSKVLDSVPVPNGLEGIGFVRLDPHRGPGLNKQIERWCRSVGFQPRIVQTASDIQTVLALVAAGVGPSILPQQATRLMQDGVRLQPLNGPDAEWETGMAWRRDNTNPALAHFLKEAEN